MQNKIERFTPNSRHILNLAQEEAKRLQHSEIGTHHILLGMIRSDYGVAGQVLRDLGLEISHVREAVERYALREESLFQQIIRRLKMGFMRNSKYLDLSPQSKQFIGLAVKKAENMGHHEVGTEHLLLGLVQQKRSIALDILKRFGISSRVIRTQTIQALNDPLIQTTETKVINQPSSFNKMERFTEKSKHVMYFAQEEAKRLQQNPIDTQHLLIGLIREKDSVASRVLREMNATADRIIELSPQLSNNADNKSLELAPDTKKVLELAVDEARLMEHKFIGTEHLLLGLIRHEKSVAFDILRQLDILPENIRLQINRYIR